MNSKKKLWSIILVLCMFMTAFCSGVGLTNAFAQDGTITRVQWLHELTTIFEMTVEEDNYPDNYYSDIDSSSEYYYDVMLATEFGLIDVEAGEQFKPNDPVTREFAAHTLNLCIGYVLEEETYTFSESASVTYPNDIQIAINQGWLALSGSNFLPEQAITTAEQTVMLDAAKEAVAATVLDESHTNTWEFAEGVVVIPETATVESTAESQFTILNAGVTLNSGDIVGFVYGGMPLAYTVESVSGGAASMIITTSSVAAEDAYAALDVQGTTEVDLAEVEAVGENSQLVYIVDGEEYTSKEEVAGMEVDRVEVVQTYELSEGVEKEFDLAPGTKATIKFDITDVFEDHKWSFTDIYVNIYGTIDFECNVSVDVLEAAGISKNIELLRVPVCGNVIYFKTSLNLELSGEITTNLQEIFCIGVQADWKDGVRFVKRFAKKSFTINAEINFSASILAEAVVDLTVLTGKLWAEVGVKGTATIETFDDGALPTRCSHFFAYIFAKAGARIDIDLVLYKDSWSRTYTIYSMFNSPVKVFYHYEDGVAVDKCTRDGSTSETTSSGSEKYKYYTPITSKYGYSGASKGLDASGNTYTIFDYELNNQNKAKITGYHGNVSALRIPETLDGYEVVEIGGSVFKNNTQLRIVVIPDSVTSIGSSAFSGCSNLSSVTLSKGVTYLGGNAFYNCDRLTSIVIPKSLENTGETPFNNCSKLVDVTFETGTTQVISSLFANCDGIQQINIPEGIVSIGESAFSNCANLITVSISETVIDINERAFEKTAVTKIVIPDSVTYIGPNAFANCNTLNDVVLSNNLMTIGYSAFGECDSIKSIKIPKSLSKIQLLHDYWSGGPFNGCTSLKEVIFEEGITEIADYTLYGCDGLTEISIPESVVKIGSGAFSNCEALSSVEMFDSVTSVQESAFANTALAGIKFSDAITYIGPGAFKNCTFLKEVILPNSLQTIGYDAFGECDALEKIYIPKSLSRVQLLYDYWSGGPFYGCSNVKSVVFEEGTEGVISYLFYGCDGLMNIDFVENIDTIGNSAFNGCTSLTSVKLSQSIIGEYAFNGCSSLSSVIYQENVKVLKKSAFAGCSSLKEVDISESVTEVGEEVFKGCTSLEKVLLSKKITAMPYGIFDGCTSLASIVIPASVTKINNFAFRDCTALASVTMSPNTQSIGNYAFYNCDALTSIDIPDSVTSLGNYCFSGCETLSDVNLGTGITTIPSYAFDLCPSLQKIVLPYRLTEIKSNAFTNCTKLTEVTIPRATTTIASSVFSYPTKMTIYGISGTYAEEYANANSIKFVNQEIPATSVSLSEPNVTINKGSSKQLVLTVTPDNFTDVVTWKSSDTSIATIADDGTLKAVGVGTATIKVYVGNASASCSVTVVQPVTYVSINKSSISLEGAATYQLTASVSPSNANNPALEWSTSDANVATVDQNGLVTAHQKGSATITAKAVDGSDEYDTCTVNVISTCYTVTDAAGFESPHPYEANCNDSWVYTVAGAVNLYVTFDAQTVIEDGFDYLYIYDASGNEVGKYTGTALAGQTVTVPGDTVKIKIVSDAAGNEWGFKVAGVSTTAPGTSGTPDAPTDPAQVEAFVERMYTVALNRQSDAAGKANWVGMLNAGTHDGAGLAREFILGEEFALRGLSDEQYVDVLYQTFFNREADAAGKELWLAVLASGQSRAYVLSNFVNLDEFTLLCDSYGIERGVMFEDGGAANLGIPKFVKRLYNNVLGRTAEAQGLYNNVLALVVKAETAETTAKNFFGSEEYALKKTDNTTYVTDLYKVFMDRAADESGLSFWVSCIEVGMTRDDILSEFAKSAEFKTIAASYGLE